MVDKKHTYVLFSLLVLTTCPITINGDCMKTPPDCPGEENGARSAGKSSTVIDGVFSISRWRSMGCSVCNDPETANVHRTSVELAEALILATEILNNVTEEEDVGFGYSITDSCGNHRNGDCIQALAPTVSTLATVVGPYYTESSISLNHTEMADLYKHLNGLPPRDDKGIFSLLDVPFPYSKTLKDLILKLDDSQIVMLQQTCELQALAAVDFMIQHGWWNVTVIGSADACGTASLLLFKQQLQRKDIACHFEVTYVQESLMENSVARDEARETFRPDYYLTKTMPAEFYKLVTSKGNFIVLSSMSFVIKVENHFGGSSSNGPRSFLIGDLWGDPHSSTIVMKKLLNLIDDGNVVYGLRNTVNGTERLSDHMMSIKFNSSRFHKNPFIQRLWEQSFSCSIANDDCGKHETLSLTPTPILRNYKAPLIIDAAFILRQYVLDFRRINNFLPTEFFDHDFYHFAKGNKLMTFNNWTGNRWLLGIPSGHNDLYEWIQPLEWSYEIVKLSNDNESLSGYLYGTWWMQKYEVDNVTGVLTLTSSSAMPPVLPLCVSLESNFSCDSNDLYSMFALIAVVVLLLVICCGVWIHKQGDVLKLLKGVITLPALVIISCTVLVSIATSMWIILGDNVVNCDNRVDDFLVTFTNSVFFAVLLVYLLLQIISNRLLKLVVKWLGFLVVVTVQLIISSTAHLQSTNEREDRVDIVGHCHIERSKAISVVSYVYGDIVCITCITLLLHNVFSKNGEYSESNCSFKLVTGFLAICVGTTYTVHVIILLLIDGHDLCVVMGRIFIVLAIFPVIVCLVNIVVLLLSEPSNAVDTFRAKSIDTSHTQCESHDYVFEGFPELTARRESMFTLERDLCDEIQKVIIEPQRIKVVESIGSGNFGQVFKGVLDGSTSVAIKAVHDIDSNKQVNDFIREGLQMQDFDHPNIMKLVGICWTEKESITLRPAAPLIVLPYMELGDLKTYLRKCRPRCRSSEKRENSIGLVQLVKFGHHIAKGMEYLAAAGIIHRDLAARNCMVNWDLEVKVADFGLSRSVAGKDYYRMRHFGCLPVKWMAPECLIDLVFATSSDVWAYGITLWEVMTLAQVPYPGVDNQDVLQYLKKEKRPEKPAECPNRVYEIMQKCWQTHAEDRPTFNDIVADIEEYLSELMDYFDPFASSDGVASPPDPYMMWKLMPIAEEMEDDEKTSEKPKEESLPLTREKSPGHKSHVADVKQKSKASGGGGASRSAISQMVLSVTKGVSLGMVRRSSSNALFLSVPNTTEVVENRTKREASV